MSTPSRCHLNIFIDSDGVIADFQKMCDRLNMKAEKFKHEPGAYTYLEKIEGVEDALKELKSLDDQDVLRVWVATKTPGGAPYAYTEKVLWFRWNFPWLENRVILCHDKSLLGTEHDVLIDDRPHKGNAQHFRGKFIHFGSDKFPTWTEVMLELRELIRENVTLNKKSHVIKNVHEYD